MAEVEHRRPPGWRCRHLHPFLVVFGAEGERRVRCLGCGTTGPSRPDLGQALLALRRSLARSEGIT
jgi:hypothetical protein